MASPVNAERVLAELHQLGELTATDEGAQRVAWGPVWRQARAWFAERVGELGLTVRRDSAGNDWVTLPGRSPHSVLLGGHLDSVPNGGWLDGSLGTLAALEALRCLAAGGEPAVTVHLVDWADEEGARFGRSLLGSSAAGGSLDPEGVRHLIDRDGIGLPEALAENGIDLDRMPAAHEELRALRPAAYLELHIEQGPVLEELRRPAGVVVGTFGVERHLLRFSGQAAHSGSTPIPRRRDAFLAAAELALEARKIALRSSGTTPETRVVSTCGEVRVEPGIVTAVPGVAEISLDQRALLAHTLAEMLEQTRAAAERIAANNRVSVDWHPLWRIEPRPFDDRLIALAEEAVREVTGDAPRLASGPLHDAAEMAPHMPTVMLFASSTDGLSHCKEEDTPVEDLRQTVNAYVRLVEKAVAATAEVAPR